MKLGYFAFVASMFLGTSAFGHVDPKIAYSEVQNGTAIIIDVRDQARIGYKIASPAQWLKFPETSSGIPNLIEQIAHCVPLQKKIYFYCYAGRWSVYFSERLQEKGFDAQSIGAFDDWKSAGLPTAQAASDPLNVTCPY
jgi:rhodanese-related sulfurtransferase